MDVARQVIKLALSTALPRRLLLSRGPARARRVALTFDDGPHPEHTPRLLDRLRETGVTATFFVVGALARRHPEIVQRIAAEGHELGNHSYSHGPPAQTSARELLDEVRRTGALLEDLTGRASTLFRPPRGELTAAKLFALWRERHCVVLWSVDPRDYAMRSPDEMRRWCARYEPRAGDIVLMHDAHPYAALAISSFAERAAAGGVELARISQYLCDR